MIAVITLLACGGIAALACALAAFRLYLRRRACVAGLALAVAFATAGTVSVAASAYGWWYYHRSPPAQVVEELFPGAEYRRIVRSSPRPVVIHVVSIDLDDDRVQLLTTPPTPTGNRQQRARTASEFAAEFDTRLAVNANFFSPWRPGFFDYYPKRGDPVDVLGWAVSRGRRYGDGDATFSVLGFTEQKRASIGPPGTDTYTAVAGKPVLIRDGVLGARAVGALAPRTAIGVDGASRRLVIVVVDGRQPNYSEGVTIFELAELMRQLGAHNAINLDGGGSSTLVARDKHGRPHVLNSPIHRRVPPGQERPVANHFGIVIKARP